MTLPTVYEEKTQFQPLPADVYRAKLLEIESKEGTYGPFWTWKFEVDEAEVPDGDYSTWQWVFSNCNLHPASTSKKSPRRIAEALLGRPLKDDECIQEGGAEYEALVGVSCRLSIGMGKPGKNGEPRNEVNAVLPLKKPAGEAPPAQNAPSLIARKNELRELLKEQGTFEEFTQWYTDNYSMPFEKMRPADMETVLAEMDKRVDISF